ncbi:MAG TPA: pectate lyase precursor [Gammaproteobacteria bacterium]|nr:pectate lyase precursor [Gammaproteobacteria bacterium]
MFIIFSIRFLLLITLIILCNPAANASLISFPGAEGFGAISIGGRGGRIIRVSNLNPDGPGSFQAACEASGPRIVIFEVSGVIRGNISIRDSNITIAGQTAPSPGITLEGRLFSWPKNDLDRLHDIIIRFLRIRPAPSTGHNGDALQLPNTERVMLDHLSLSWANDEVIDIIYSSEVTLQWSTIEESDPRGHGKGVPHNYAVLSAYPGSGNITFHHNLFANHSRRIPSLTPETPGKYDDFRNNLIYNFREGLGHDGHKPVAGINLIGNYYKRGSESWTVTPFSFSEDGHYYLHDNYLEGYGSLGQPEHKYKIWPLWLKFRRNGAFHNKPFPVAKVNTETAKNSYHSILKLAGAFPRDRVTKRTINEIETGKGSWRRNAPDNPDDAWYLKDLPVEKLAIDSDKDGIPDIWETSNHLDKNDPNDYGRIMKSGYTAIEEYINDRALELINKYSNY